MAEYFFVGTYTEPILFGTGELFCGNGEGIYFCKFNAGQITILSKISVRNPSFLCINNEKKRIYAVNELKEYMGKFGGGITEISFDENGKMDILQTCCTGGADPCHIATSPQYDRLVVSNFSSGSISIFPLDQAGTVNPRYELFSHCGKSVHPVRQQGPHAHSAIFADGQRFYVPDLGLDKIICYDVSDKHTCPCNRFTKSLQPGSGPRFGEFSPDGQHFYLINEISSSVTHFLFSDGQLTEEETISTLPGNCDADNICSDLHISPNGKFLYASNRGHNSIAAFRIGSGGTLNLIEVTSCLGKTPRNFSLTNCGDYLLLGNQDSDSIVTFQIEETGHLTFVSKTEFPTPVCIRFMRKRTPQLSVQSSSQL